MNFMTFANLNVVYLFIILFKWINSKSMDIKEIKALFKAAFI